MTSFAPPSPFRFRRFHTQLQSSTPSICFPPLYPNISCVPRMNSKSKSNKPNRKRPRSSTPGATASTSSGGFQILPLDTSMSKSTSSETPSIHPELSQTNKDNGGPDLKKTDSNGISLEHRLREEIKHPLRKPKQTLFATLSFSATIGLLFAFGRLAMERDSIYQVSKNVAIDITAILIFAYLTWREFEFGRRSLNSMAGIPQARDLPILSQQLPASVKLPFSNNFQSERLSQLLSQSDVVVVAGRREDVLKYVDRCETEPEPEHASKKLSLVAFATDSIGTRDESFKPAKAVASGKGEGAADWIAWLGDATPPRRNVALFRIDAKDKGSQSASSYAVAVDDPSSLPLPRQARRPLVVDV